MATRTISNAGGNWSATTAWVEGVVPTQVDDVVATATSGALTVTAGAVCRSAIFTGYVSTLTIPAGVTLSIGDMGGSQNAGNILTLATGMTVSLGLNTATIALVSTGATQQDVLTNGKSLGALNIVGVGCSIRLAAALTCTGLLTLTAGTLSTNAKAVSCQGFQSDNSNTRTLDITGSTVTVGVGAVGMVVWGTTTTTGLTFVSTGSTVVVTVPAENSNAAVQVGSGLTFNNMTFSGGAVANTGMGLAGSFTVAGTLAFTGNSARNRMWVGSQTLLNTVAITANGTVTLQYADLRDIVASGSASWNLAAATGGSGDCGGNTGITFTPSATQTWIATAGGSWSTVGCWSGRIPLPQDDVSMACAFSASSTVTAAMSRLGRSIDWTGCTGNSTLSITGAPNRTIYGSMKLVPGVGVTASVSVVCESRGPATWTSAGVGWQYNWFCQAPGGMTFLDAFTTTGRIYLTAGTLDGNGFTITSTAVMSQGTIPRVLRMGSGTWTCIGASPLSFVGSNLTVVCGTSTVACTIASTTPGTFDTAGATFNIVTVAAGRTGVLTFSGNATFNSLVAQPGNKLTFTSGTTVTVNAMTASGVSGNVVTFAATVVGTPFTITSPNQISLDYVSLQDSAAVGAFFAGTHSTNVSGNSGWSFTAAGGFAPALGFGASRCLGGL